MDFNGASDYHQTSNFFPFLHCASWSRRQRASPRLTGDFQARDLRPEIHPDCICLGHVATFETITIARGTEYSELGPALEVGS